MPEFILYSRKQHPKPGPGIPDNNIPSQDLEFQITTSQARTWNSNIIGRGLLCVQSVEMRDKIR
jgi:hypothetical protein